jgi:hypothetical protein
LKSETLVPDEAASGILVAPFACPTHGVLCLMPSKKEIQELYGRNAVVSRKRPYLWFTWKPSRATVNRRRKEFDPMIFFCPDCPLCQLLKKSGIVVFDDSIYDEDEESLIT